MTFCNHLLESAACPSPTRYDCNNESMAIPGMPNLVSTQDENNLMMQSWIEKDVTDKSDDEHIVPKVFQSVKVHVNVTISFNFRRALQYAEP